MTWFERLFGRTPPGVPASEPALSDARAWLAATSGRDCIWRDLGDLDLPDRRMFVGDPTGGHGDHLRGMATVEADRLHLWGPSSEHLAQIGVLISGAPASSGVAI